tara:strand:+ start:665 stop:1006 length:342 start_codon:yes stop_codon:yes gene_type:complete
MSSENEILTFYHTAIRNVGLYTSISFALLASSRFYRGKNKAYNVLFLLLSLSILFCAISLCKFLIDDVKSMKENLEETKYLSKWQTIPQAILYIDIAIGFIIIFTLVKELYKK